MSFKIRKFMSLILFFCLFISVLSKISFFNKTIFAQENFVIKLKDNLGNDLSKRVVDGAGYSLYYKTQNGQYALHPSYSTVRVNENGELVLPTFSTSVECLVVEKSAPLNFISKKVSVSGLEVVFFYDSYNKAVTEYGNWNGSTWDKKSEIVYTKDDSRVNFDIVDRRYNLIKAQDVTNAKYDLYYKAKGGTNYQKVSSQSNISADENGNLTFPTFSGNNEFIIVETVSPTGYTFPLNLYKYSGLPENSKPCAYYETTDGKVTEYGILDITTKDWKVNNNKILHSDGGMVDIVKVDGDERPVSEITMALKDFETGADFKIGKTDEKGKFKFEHLPKGKYILYEKEAKVGYIKTDEEWIVEVDDNGNTNVSYVDENGKTRSVEERRLLKNLKINSLLNLSLVNQNSKETKTQIIKDTENKEVSDISKEYNVIDKIVESRVDKLKDPTSNENLVKENLEMTEINFNSMLRAVPDNNKFVTNDSTTTITKNGYSVTQTIQQTSTDGMYKVDVQVKRISAPKVPKYTDYVFAIEASDYTSGDNQRMGLAERVSGWIGINKKLRMTEYYDLISEFADKLKTTQPNARIGIILYGNNGTGGKGIVEKINFVRVQDIRATLQIYRSKEYGVNADKDWSFPYNGYNGQTGSIDMFRNADPDNDRNRVLINVTSGGLNESSGGLNPDSKKLDTELIKTGLLQRSADEKIDIYYSGEWAKNADANHSNSTQLEYYLSESYTPFGQNYPVYGKYSNYLRTITGGNPIKAVKTFYDNVTSSTKEGLKNSYRNTWNNWATRYNEVSPEKNSMLVLNFNDNIVLNTQKAGAISVSGTNNTMNAVVENNSIVARNLKFQQNETKYFSYYVHANSEKKGINFYQSATTPNWNYINDEANSGFYVESVSANRIAVPNVYHTIPSINIKGKVDWNKIPDWQEQQLWVMVRDKSNKIVTDWTKISKGTQNYIKVSEVPVFDNEGNKLEYYFIHEKISEKFDIAKATLTQPELNITKEVPKHSSFYSGNPEFSNLPINSTKDAYVALEFKYKSKDIKVKVDWHLTPDAEKYPVTIKLTGKVKDENGVEKDITDTLKNIQNQGDVSDKALNLKEKFETKYENLREYDLNDRKIIYDVKEIKIDGKEISKIENYSVEYIYLDKNFEPVSPQDPSHPDIDTIVISNMKIAKPIQVVNELEKQFYVLKTDEKGEIIAGKTEPTDENPQGTVISENGKYLVYFALFDKNGNQVKKFPSGELIEFTTNHKGKLNYRGLSAGQYTLKEIKQPNGYVLSDKEWKVTITDDGEVSYEEINKNSSRNTRIRTIRSIYEDALKNVVNNNGTDEKLASLYPENNTNPSEYINDEKGEYAKNGQEYSKRVINTEINKKEILESPQVDKTYYYYNGIWAGKETMTAGVNKFAEPTSTDGKFNINLQVVGNTVELDEKTDIVIVYDASRSMWQYDRVEPAYNATKDFVERMLSPEINSLGNIRVGLVTYGSDIFDGRTTNLKNYDYYGNFYNKPNVKTTDNCYKGLTKNAYDITSKLFTKDNANSLYDPKLSKDYNNTVWLGGTFATKALKEAQDILDNSDATHKIVIHVTDGMPTKSLRVTKVEDVKGVKLATEFKDHNSNYVLTDKAYGYNQKGDGTSFYFKEVADQNNLHAKYTVDGYKIETHGFVTESFAESMKKKGTEIFSIGINIGEDDFKSFVDKPNVISKEEAKNLLVKMSSNKENYFDTENINMLPENFNKILKNVLQSTVRQGQITDPMGEMVKLDLGKNGKFDVNDYTLFASDGSKMIKGVVYDRNNKVVIGGSLLNGVTVTNTGGEKGTLKIDGLNLGKNEWVRIKYSVNLDAGNPNFKGMKFFHTNKETYLIPNINYSQTKWKFPLPAVKGPRDTVIEIINEPNEVIFSKTNSDGEFLEGTEFVLYDENGQYINGSERIVGQDGKIRYEKLAPGNYLLKETKTLPNYKSLGTVSVFTVQSNGKVALQGETAADSAYKIIVNERDYTPMKFKINKIDKTDKTIIKNGNLGMKIEKLNGNGEDNSILFDEVYDLSTVQDDGKEVIVPVDAKSGEYVLTETKAPDGYAVTKDKYVISVDQNRRTISLLRIERANGEIETINQLLYKEKINSGAEDEIESTSISVNMENRKIATYPLTGSYGSVMFLVSGITTMGISGVFILKRKLKNK